MIARTFRTLDGQPDLEAGIHGMKRFDTAYAAWPGQAPEPLRNPYSHRPARSYWPKAVARPNVREMRPGGDLKPVITPETRVATAVSCFAQHVARAMMQDGLNY